MKAVEDYKLWTVLNAIYKIIHHFILQSDHVSVCTFSLVVFTISSHIVTLYYLLLFRWLLRYVVSTYNYIPLTSRLASVYPFRPNDWTKRCYDNSTYRNFNAYQHLSYSFPLNSEPDKSFTSLDSQEHSFVFLW